MKKIKKRSLLLIALIAILCAILTGCTKNTDVSEVQASFDDKTITIYSPEDNACKLVITLEINSTFSSLETNNLYVSAGVRQTYFIEDFYSPNISKDAKISDINLVSTKVKDFAAAFILYTLIILAVLIISLSISRLFA